MVICPICKKPFPKKRQELGYNYCVNCSTERNVVCVIEGTQEGDGDDTVHNSITIMSQRDALAVNLAKRNSRADVVEDETVLEMDKTEDRDENVETVNEPSTNDLDIDFDEQTLSEIEESLDEIREA